MTNFTDWTLRAGHWSRIHAYRDSVGCGAFLVIAMEVRPSWFRRLLGAETEWFGYARAKELRLGPYDTADEAKAAIDRAIARLETR